MLKYAVFYLVKSNIYNKVKNVLWKISINSVDFDVESVIIDCLYSGTFLIEQLKKHHNFNIKINKLLDVLIQFREAPLINFTKYGSK